MLDDRIHASVIDAKAREQIDLIVQSPAFAGQKVSIMPDVHFGAGCVIGFTATLGKAVSPNVVGVDIGCGVLGYPLAGVESVDWERFDGWLRSSIPLGTTSHPEGKTLSNVLSMLRDPRASTICERARSFYAAGKISRYTDPARQIGTLGGGNHFVEVDRVSSGEYWLVIHSGSRNFGKQVADFFQHRAKEWCVKNGISTPAGLEYLPVDGEGKEYLRWLGVAQEYAALNRRAMVIQALKFFGIRYEEEHMVESVHNYLGKDGIVRKGAISAQRGERVLIPLNMAEGVVVGKGLGNPDYNYSAPHGAGRRYGRGAMKDRMASGLASMEEFHARMEGIFSTSVSERTMDESPMAYKTFWDIQHHLAETVSIESVMSPCYNLKAEELSPKEQKALRKMKAAREKEGLDNNELDFSEGEIGK